ncbi:hypothetical protein NKI54_15750 [Mesorhizobium sp. M0663]|uniref:hypothetical protein n=1 Tax=unclassified Mesorhizobium TaxID=325217 RepID=UPI0033370F23
MIGLLRFEGRVMKVPYERQMHWSMRLKLLTDMAPRSLRARDPGSPNLATTAPRFPADRAPLPVLHFDD